ncbi:hypothetical protein CPB84DRAFT_1876869, partial [Gymnopilus junonius]
WKDKSIEHHFRIQRRTVSINDSQPNPAISALRLRRMKELLSEIDGGLKFIPSTGKVMNMKFLDLCCCPGGFSSYILGKNAKTQGVGISLSVSDGGQELALEDHHRQRFQLLNGDLTYYQLGPTMIPNQRLHDLPPQINGQSFNLVILDGYQLRRRPSDSSLNNDRLLISQIILALQTVKVIC